MIISHLKWRDINMRDIKFRAWYTNRNSFYIFGSEAIRLMLSKPHGSDCVIEQYTGLKDVNGVEIYEGDVLQPVRVYPDFLNIAPSKIGKAFLVKSGNYVFGKWIARLIGDKGYSVSDYYFGNELNIIGNIHEQPELLEDR